MPRFQYKRHTLYVLATILLLLQSFAAWHDATHPFHADEVQCERLSAIHHVPGADLVAEFVPVHQFVTVSIEPHQTVPSLPSRRTYHAPIRAPPAFS